MGDRRRNSKERKKKHDNTLQETTVVAETVDVSVVAKTVKITVEKHTEPAVSATVLIEDPTSPEETVIEAVTYHQETATPEATSKETIEETAGDTLKSIVEETTKATNMETVQEGIQEAIQETPEEEFTVNEATESAVMQAESNDKEEVSYTAEKSVGRESTALQIVNYWTRWSIGAGLVPVPLLDMIAVTTLQINMLKKLSTLYAIPFHEQRSKSAIAALIGGVNSGILGGSALKTFPVIGIFSLAAMPIINGAFTFAIGKVFIQHFSSGGTFLDFEPATVKAYFAEQYRLGKLVTEKRTSQNK